MEWSKKGEGDRKEDVGIRPKAWPKRGRGCRPLADDNIVTLAAGWGQYETQ